MPRPPKEPARAFLGFYSTEKVPGVSNGGASDSISGSGLAAFSSGFALVSGFA